MKLQIFFQIIVLALASNISLYAQVFDNERNVYRTVKIGQQEWMTENLNVSRFNNGDLIPLVKSNDEWKMAGENGQPACCYYQNDSTTGKKYGMFYNWYAVNDPRGITPVGYRIPTKNDWDLLRTTIGNQNIIQQELVGLKMKSTTDWIDNGNGTNESGFMGLPAGLRNYDGNFVPLGMEAHWWSTTRFMTLVIHTVKLSSSNKSLKSNQINEKWGLSVRCIKNE